MILALGTFNNMYVWYAPCDVQKCYQEAIESLQLYMYYEEENSAYQIINHEDQNNHYGGEQVSLLKQKRFKQMEMTFTLGKNGAWLYA